MRELDGQREGHCKEALNRRRPQIKQVESERDSKQRGAGVQRWGEGSVGVRPGAPITVRSQLGHSSHQTARPLHTRLHLLFFKSWTRRGGGVGQGDGQGDGGEARRGVSSDSGDSSERGPAGRWRGYS